MHDDSEEEEDIFQRRIKRRKGSQTRQPLPRGMLEIQTQSQGHLEDPTVTLLWEIPAIAMRYKKRKMRREILLMMM